MRQNVAKRFTYFFTKNITKLLHIKSLVKKAPSFQGSLSISGLIRFTYQDWDRLQPKQKLHGPWWRIQHAACLRRYHQFS